MTNTYSNPTTTNKSSLKSASTKSAWRQDAQEAEDLKLPPYSLEAEQSVLGGLIIDNAAMDGVSELLVEGDFYLGQHRCVFRLMQDLTKRNSPFDPLILSAELKARDELDQAGGDTYLLELARNTPSTSNVLAYAQLVRERSVRRKLIQSARRIADAAYNPEGRTSDELLNEAEKEVFAIAEERPQLGGPRQINDVAAELVNRLEALDLSKGGLTGLSTGFTELDKMTSGLQPSDLVIVAGRPSMGKTTFAMNLVENAVMHSASPALVFSMEMPAEQLLMRMLSSLGRIDQTKVRTGQLATEDWDRIASTLSILKEKKLYIDDTPGLSPNDLRTRARRIVRDEGNLSIIMVDYLQLMRVPGNSENRTAEISEISRSLKALAKEFNCPVVALSQLNRGLEQRTNKRPIMSDLRESGAIEQDADVIAFVYRDEVYHPEKEGNKGLAEIIIGKHRNGPVGSLHLLFTGRFTRFDDLAPESYAQYREAGLIYEE